MAGAELVTGSALATAQEKTRAAMQIAVQRIISIRKYLKLERWQGASLHSAPSHENTVRQPRCSLQAGDQVVVELHEAGVLGFDGQFGGFFGGGNGAFLVTLLGQNLSFEMQQFESDL